MALGAALVAGFVAGVVTTTLATRPPAGEAQPVARASTAVANTTPPARGDRAGAEIAAAKETTSPFDTEPPTSGPAIGRPARLPAGPPAERGPFAERAARTRPAAGDAPGEAGRGAGATGGSMEAALARADDRLDDPRDPGAGVPVPLPAFDDEEQPQPTARVAAADDREAPVAPGTRRGQTGLEGVTPPRPGRTRLRPDGKGTARVDGRPGRWSIGVYAGPRAYGPPEWGAAPSAAGARTGATASVAIAEHELLQPRIGLSLDVGAALVPSVLPPDGSATASAELRFALGAVHPVVGWAIGGELHPAPKPVENLGGPTGGGGGGAGWVDPVSAPEGPRAALVSGALLGVDIGHLDRPHLQLRVDVTTRIGGGGRLPPPAVGLLVGVELPLHGGEG